MCRRCNFTLLTLFLVLAMSFGVCAKGYAAAGILTAKPVKSAVETRISVYQTERFYPDEKMAIPAVVSGLASLLAQGFIDKGFDLLSLALKKAAGKAAVADVSVKAGGMQFAIVKDKAPGPMDVKLVDNAISIVHGRFGLERMDASTLAEELRSQFYSFAESLAVTTQIEYSPDGSAFRLVPHFVYYNGGIAGKKKIDVAVHYTFKLPAKTGAGDDSKAYGSATITFEDLRKGALLETASLKAKSSEWIALPVFSSWNTKNTHVPVPFIVEARVVETRNANKLLEIMSEVFEESKDELKKAVKAEIKITTK